MKIGYFGDGPWAYEAINRIIINPNYEVSFIVGRNETTDSLLEKAALENDIPFLKNKNVNSKDFIKLISQFEVDINVSMSFDQILKKEIINLAPKGFINCHAGLLPFYRGRNPLNWALINDEKYFGVTVHYVDENIDTGDIIVQNTANIDLSDTYKNLLEKAYALCADSLLEALDLIINHKSVRIKQNSIHPKGFYCGKRRAGDEILDWSWTSRRIHNFVRAITIPGPGARTFFNGKQIAVLSTTLIDNAPDYIGTCGEVVGRVTQGVIVKTGDNTICVNEIADIDENGCIVKPQFRPNFLIGSRLGKNIWTEVDDLKNKILKLESIMKNNNLI